MLRVDTCELRKHVQNEEVNWLIPLYAVGPVPHRVPDSGDAVRAVPNSEFVDGCDAGLDHFHQDFGPSVPIPCEYRLQSRKE